MKCHYVEIGTSKEIACGITRPADLRQVTFDVIRVTCKECMQAPSYKLAASKAQTVRL